MNNYYITSFNGRDCGQNYMTAGGACNTGSLAVGFTGPVITPDNLQVTLQVHALTWKSISTCHVPLAEAMRLLSCSTCEM